MTLFLIRHGETVSSRKTYAGRSDVALNSHGRSQAQIIAQHLANQPISHILSSPLSRAVDTARPLALVRDLNPAVEPLLMEFDFGDYEGRSKQSLGLTLRKTHAYVPVPGGESLIDVWNRAGKVLDRLSIHGTDSPCSIAVVGHFWINRMIWGQINGLNFEATCRSRFYRPETGSILTL